MAKREQSKMNERYTRVFTLPRELYVKGTPVAIENGRLLYDNERDCKVVAMNFRNISDKEISFVSVSVKAYNAWGEALEGVASYTYSKLKVLSGEEFGYKKAIRLPEKNTSTFRIEIKTVLFADGSVWNCPHNTKLVKTADDDDLYLQRKAQCRTIGNSACKSAGKRRKKHISRTVLICAATILILCAVIFFGKRFITNNGIKIFAGYECKEHTFGEWAEDVQSTCSVHGKEVRKCTDCKYFEERDLPLAKHPYGEWTVEVQSTCRSNGSEIRTCAHCQTIDRRELPLLEHIYGEWVVVSEATYTSVGQERVVCTECGDQKFQDVPMKKPTVVKLTRDNIEEYFEISCWVSDYYEKQGSIFRYGYADVNVSCKQIVNGDPKNVKVSIDFSARGGAWPGEGDGSFILTIPETEKKASRSQEIGVCSVDSSEIVKPSIRSSITNVEGTLTIYP